VCASWTHQRLIKLSQEFPDRPDYAIGTGGQTYKGYKPVSFSMLKTAWPRLRAFHVEIHGWKLLDAQPLFVSDVLCVTEGEIRLVNDRHDKADPTSTPFLLIRETRREMGELQKADPLYDRYVAHTAGAPKSWLHAPPAMSTLAAASVLIPVPPPVKKGAHCFKFGIALTCTTVFLCEGVIHAQSSGND